MIIYILFIAMFIYFQTFLNSIQETIDNKAQHNVKVISNLYDAIQIIKTETRQLYEKYKQLSTKTEPIYNMHPLGFKYKGTTIYDYYSNDPIGYFSKNCFKLDKQKIIITNELVERYKALVYINKNNSFLTEDETLPFVKTHDIKFNEHDLYTWNKNKFGYWYHRPTGYILKPNTFSIIGKHSQNGAILCFSESDFHVFRQWENMKDCPLSLKNISLLFLTEYKNYRNNKIF